MKKFLALFLLTVVWLLASCSSSTATTSIQQPTATPQATPSLTKPTPKPTRSPIKPTPTKQAGYPVCNSKGTNTPCVQYASIQDAAAGESSVGADVHTSISKGVAQVSDDITNVASTALGPPTTLNNIQFQCFNIQQGLWYALKSLNNADGSLTFRKSAFAEVDVSFIDHNKGNAAFASCSLTSAGVDKIDKAGMWNDGDYVGAWSVYDSASFE